MLETKIEELTAAVVALTKAIDANGKTTASKPVEKQEAKAVESVPEPSEHTGQSDDELKQVCKDLCLKIVRENREYKKDIAEWLKGKGAKVIAELSPDDTKLMHAFLLGLAGEL